MSNNEPAAITELREQIVATAAEAIVATMTPAMMRKCAEGVLETVLADISDRDYGPLASLVRDKVQTAMAEYLETPIAENLIKGAVIRGVQLATDDLDIKVQAKLIETALTGVVKSLQGGRR